MIPGLVYVYFIYVILLVTLAFSDPLNFHRILEQEKHAISHLPVLRKIRKLSSTW